MEAHYTGFRKRDYGPEWAPDRILCQDGQIESLTDNHVFYSITSSSRASNVGGTTMPSVFAVFMLITRPNFVGC
jgi:hypothetical protein